MSGPRGNVNHFRRPMSGCLNLRLRFSNFRFEWQLVKHVRQRLDMHQSVFDGRIEEKGTAPGSFQSSVQPLANSRSIAINFKGGRPVRGNVRRKSAVNWIDSECEQLIQDGIKR